MKEINIILHTHWDREWYFTTSDSLVLMDRTFKNIITELNKNKNISFCLDGQYSIIEEFLNINPHLEEEVKKLVLEDRLFIGPWYTQTDAQLVNGESIIKNLYYGMYETKKRFGKVMEVGYLPDTFGFNNQMPEILKQASIDSIIFWRGSSYKNQKLKPYFLWKSLSNTKCKAINLVGGYGSNKGMNLSNSYINNTFLKTIEVFENLGIEHNFLIPVGNDQNEIIENSETIVKELSQKTGVNIKISNYKDTITKLFNEPREVYQGEFRKTEHTRIHKTIGSVRYEVKKTNHEVEEHLLNVTEPLIVIAEKLKINISPRLAYKAWSLLFEGQAHDGICGCISDDVTQDLLNRNKRALEISKSIENMILKQLSVALQLKSSEILVVNTNYLTKPTHEVVILTQFENIQIKDADYCIVNTKKIKGIKDALVETPSGNYYEDTADYYEHKVIIQSQIKEFGYKVFEFTKLENKNSSLVSSVNKIENAKYIISFENNSLKFVDKDSGDIVEDFIYLQDCANDGDTYDFSPLLGDEAIKINFTKAEVLSFNLKQIMKLNCKINLPMTLNDRNNLENTKEIKFNLTLEIDQNSLIRGILEFNNQVYSHRIRLGIRSNIKNSQSSLASTNYGVVKRDILNGIVEEGWEKENVEIPIDIELTDGFVTYNDNVNKFNVFTTYAKEYQIINDTIFMTVLATTGELGKPNLLYRPGRASGDVTKKGHIMIKTPLAQSIGKVKYEFALSYGNQKEFDLYEQLNSFRTKHVSYQNQEYNKFYNRIDNKIFPFGSLEKVKNEFQLLKINTNCIITNISKDLDGRTIIRGINNDSHNLKIDSKYYKGFEYVNLFGEKVDKPQNKYEIFNVIMEEK